MNFLEARDVMFGVLKPLADAGGWPVDWPDVPFEIPTSATVWCRATIQHNGGGQGSLSNESGVRRWERSGIYSIQVFAPVGDGSKAGYLAAQSVVDALQVASHANLWYRNIRMREVGVSGAFRQLNVTAEFEYDDVR